MQLEAKKYLYDVKQAGELLAEFSAGKSFADYQADAMLRSAVERQFEIAGEALSKFAKLDGELVEQINDYRRIIAFRNVLIMATIMSTTGSSGTFWKRSYRRCVAKWLQSWSSERRR